MATHKQAEKRHRQSLKRRARNASVKSELRTAIRKLRTALTAGRAKDVQPIFKDTQSLLFRAVAKGIIPKQRAARQISRLNVALSNLK